MDTKKDYRKILGNNINFLLLTFGISRKELCEQLDIKYTTLCDWLNAATYPRIDTLEKIAGYFSLEVPDMFIELEKDENMSKRIYEYARRFALKEDYSDTYSKNFWQLFGKLKDADLEIPEDLPLNDEDTCL